jgi:hypothetical protein
MFNNATAIKSLIKEIDRMRSQSKLIYDKEEPGDEGGKIDFFNEADWVKEAHGEKKNHDFLFPNTKRILKWIVGLKRKIKP